MYCHTAEVRLNEFMLSFITAVGRTLVCPLCAIGGHPAPLTEIAAFDYLAATLARAKTPTLKVEASPPAKAARRKNLKASQNAEVP